MPRVKKKLNNIKKLDGIYNSIPDEKKVVAIDLMLELQFMSETLSELKATVKSDGAVEMFEQGKQKFMRESPALKGYNTTIQRYSAIYKQLTDLIPKIEVKPESDGFDEFVGDRSD
jgi:hypothetical protein